MQILHYSILFKGLGHPWILVISGVMELTPHRYWRTAVLKCLVRSNLPLNHIFYFLLLYELNSIISPPSISSIFFNSCPEESLMCIWPWLRSSSKVEVKLKASILYCSGAQTGNLHAALSLIWRTLRVTHRCQLMLTSGLPWSLESHNFRDLSAEGEGILDFSHNWRARKSLRDFCLAHTMLAH